MKDVIKWGIVGAGNIANKFAKAVKNVKGCELVAVSSNSEIRGKDFAQKHGIPNVFVGYEEMAKSNIVDAVYVATTHHLHKPCAEIFLNAKKHVLCEKPVCINAKMAKELLNCAKANGVFLMEAMWTRFLPAIAEAKKIIDSGVIGEIREIKADFCYNCPIEEDPKLYSNELAGGSLLDVGIYGLNFASIFLGDKIEKIQAISNVVNGVDLNTNILLKYKDGVIASISSAINVEKKETAYIYGSKGYIALPHFYGSQEIILNVNKEQKSIVKNSIGEGFEEEIIEVCSCIKNGKLQSQIMPMQESIRILEIMDNVREKIELKYPFDK